MSTDELSDQQLLEQHRVLHDKFQAARQALQDVANELLEVRKAEIVRGLQPYIGEDGRVK
jgi:hypothetical protein